MSYDVSLMRFGQVVEVEHFTEGGTYPLGGTNEAHINITYNYSFFFHHFLDKDHGLRWLYGKEAQATIERLEEAVKILGTRQYPDYWADTPGNAGYALSILLKWAKQHPDAIWEGD